MKIDKLITTIYVLLSLIYFKNTYNPHLCASDKSRDVGIPSIDIVKSTKVGIDIEDVHVRVATH